MSKIALLVNGALEDKEIDTLNANLFTMRFVPKYHAKENSTNLFIKFDCVIFDLEEPEARLYLSQESKAMNTANVKTVYMAPRGVHLDVEAIKEKLNCNYCIKYLPEKGESKQDYINKFLADHISKVTLSYTNQLKSYLVKKLSCICN